MASNQVSSTTISLLEKANHYREAGSLNEAIAVYQEAIKLQSDDANIYDILGQAYAQKGDWAGAVALYKQAIELGLDKPFWTYKNLGDALRQKNCLDEAIANYQKAIALNPGNPEVYDSLAQAQSQQGDYLEAIANYQKVIELGLEEPFWTYVNLGNDLVKQNRLEEAIVSYQNAIKAKPRSAETLMVYNQLGLAQANNQDLDSAIQTYRTGINIYPSQIQEFEGLKQVLMGQNRLKESESLKQIQEPKSQENGSSSTESEGQAVKTKPDDFLSYFNLGKALSVQGRLTEASDNFSQAIRLNSNFADGYSFLGKALSEQGQLTEAIAAFKKAIELDENQPSWVRENLAEVLAQANHPKLEQFNQMSTQINELEQSSQSCLNLANKLLKEGKLERAEHLYEAAIALQPNSHSLEAYRKLAELQVKLKKYEEAIANYQKAIEIEPNAHLYDLLATPLEKLKRWSEIVTVYCRAIELKPDYYFYHHRLGNFYHKIGKTKEAIASYYRAIELNPEYVWVHYHLGETFKVEGNFKEAINCYQTALKIQPDLERASKALADAIAKQKQLEAQLSSARKKVQITVDDRPKSQSNLATGTGLKIVFYPRFQDKQSYTDHLYRMFWYLNPLIEQIEKITIPVKFKDINPDVCPSYLDEKSADFYTRFADKISFNYSEGVDDFVKEIKSASFLLRWNMKEDKDSASKDPGVDLIRTKKVWRVDHHKEQFAGSFYLKCVVENDREYDRNLSESKEKLHDIAESLKSDLGFIFGTGPSLSQAYNFRFNNGETIACNSMLKNKTLMEYLSPRLIVAADPIFHAGCSSYAADFRKYLCDALEYFQSHLVVPMRDIHIYKHNLPAELSKRVIGIPLEKAEQPNLNLLEQFHVTSTGNVLTLYLLPLATTLFNKIGIMGCDGRPLKEDNYFWKHDPSSQFVNKMSVIQEAHGAFFAIDYNDYYLTHCDTLQKWLTAAEGIGKEARNLTPSYIPALQERTSSIQNNSLPAWVNVNGSQALGEPLVSIIMPARNAAETIANSIKSIQDEELKEWEVIVINDGSMDDTVAVVEQISQSDPRVGIYHTGGRGVSFARNVALSVARGKYIGFLDADDLFENQALTKRVKALEANPDWSGVYCRTEIVDDDLNQLGWSVGDYKRKISFLDLHGNIHLASVVAKADVLRSQSFQVGLANGEDWLYLSQVLRSGNDLQYVPDCNIAYRIHERSTVLQDFVGHENKLLEVIDILYGNDPECTSPADKYKFGLSQVKSPDKQLIILKRRISLLSFLLLSRKARQFYECIQDTRTLPWHNLDEKSIIGSVRSTTMRYYACSKQLWLEKFQQNSNYIQQVFSDFKIEKIAPEFCQVVSKICS